MNIQQLRAETPGCAGHIHLNNAGSALMPEPVARVIRDHLDLESLIGGYEAEEERQNEIDTAYQAIASLVGAHPRNIAFTEHATASFIQGLSCVPFAQDDVILTTQNDYASNQIQFLSLQRRIGVEVVRAPDCAEGGVDVEQMAALIRQRRPRLVSVTHVPTNSGLVQDVRAIGSVCREEGIWYLVDACQSIGQMPINVESIGCDFLTASSRKFLRGPRGAGFLFVSDRVLECGLEPLFIDMRGADWTARNEYSPAPDAKRFENWEFAWATVLGMGRAAQYAMQIGLEKIEARVRNLAARLRKSLAELQGMRVLDQGRDLCAIVSIAIDGCSPREMVQALRQRKINTWAQRRVSAVLDYDQKEVTDSLRLSPHYYNTEDEIDRAVGSIKEVISQNDASRL